VYVPWYVHVYTYHMVRTYVRTYHGTRVRTCVPYHGTYTCSTCDVVYASQNICGSQCTCVPFSNQKVVTLCHISAYMCTENHISTYHRGRHQLYYLSTRLPWYVHVYHYLKNDLKYKYTCTYACTTYLWYVPYGTMVLVRVRTYTT
jgi:hypothetical protein